MPKGSEPKAIEQFHEAKGEFAATLAKLTNVLEGLQRDIAELEAQKAARAAEVSDLTRALEPLRREADGQRREVSKAYEQARLAKVEFEKQEQELKAKIAKLQEQEQQAKERAEAAYVEHMKTHQAEIDSISKTLEAKQQELEAFKKKISKGL